MRRLLAALAMIGLSGCASIKFYSTPDMGPKSEVGLKVYYPKPYLLVARDGTAKVTSVTLIYMPDLANPVYARTRSGYGSANLTLAFSTGMLTSLGQQTDTKIPESLTSVGGLLSSVGALEKALAEADKVHADIERQGGGLGEVEPKLRSLATDIDTVLAQDSALHALSARNVSDLKLSRKDLLDLADAVSAPGSEARRDELIANLEGTAKTIGGVKPAIDPPSEATRPVWDKVAALKRDLAEILDKLKPKPAAPAALTLYEVIMTRQGGSSVTTLHEVPMSLMDSQK